MTDTTQPSTSPTTSRAESLAAALDEINARIIATVETCTDEQWRRPTAAEGWPVGVVAHHIAEVQRFFGGTLATAAAGGAAEPAGLTAAFVEENNARHARDAAGIGKKETLALLRAAGGEASRTLRGLDETRLDAVLVVFDGNALTVAQTVEGALIGHFEEHLASIRATG